MENTGNTEIFSGSNGLLGNYSVKTIDFDSSSGALSIGYVYSPYVAMQNIAVTISSSGMFEKENRKKIYDKRKEIAKKLLN